MGPCGSPAKQSNSFLPDKPRFGGWPSTGLKWLVLVPWVLSVTFFYSFGKTPSSVIFCIGLLPRESWAHKTSELPFQIALIFFFLIWWPLS